MALLLIVIGAFGLFVVIGIQANHLIALHHTVDMLVNIDESELTVLKKQHDDLSNCVATRSAEIKFETNATQL